MRARILVVDDEPIVRQFIGVALSGHGYEVLLAASGAEALEKFERNRGSISLLLTEWTLPDSTGEALAARLRAKQNCLPVIYMTGDCQADTREAVLLKPFTACTLLRTIGGHCCEHPRAA